MSPEQSSGRRQQRRKLGRRSMKQLSNSRKKMPAYALLDSGNPSHRLVSQKGCKRRHSCTNKRQSRSRSQSHKRVSRKDCRHRHKCTRHKRPETQRRSCFMPRCKESSRRKKTYTSSEVASKVPLFQSSNGLKSTRVQRFGRYTVRSNTPLPKETSADNLTSTSTHKPLLAT